MKLYSWNVNGLRAVMKKGDEGTIPTLDELLATLDADVFGIQETKLQAGQAAPDLAGYYEFWSYAERKGYSGTAVFTREMPLQVLHGLGVSELDTEGRICALEFPEFWFVCVYTPNAQNELARLDHRMTWDDAFRDFCKGLEEGVLPEGVPVERADAQGNVVLAAESALSEPQPMGASHLETAALPLVQAGETATPKPVVTCGDFNCAHEEIDLKNPSTNHGNPGFSDEEREKFTKLLDAGFTDTFRAQFPKLEGAYSWWSYRMRARERNVGWRIDYFLVSDALAPQVENAAIYPEVFGSDHCPVGIELRD